jgi:hypothetical protein
MTLAAGLGLAGALVALATALLMAWRKARRIDSTCSVLERTAFVLVLGFAAGGVCA